MTGDIDGASQVEVLGDRLIQLLSRARQEVVIAAPFMKSHALRRLLSGVRDGVAVSCVTRWHALEVANGVSDLLCFEDVEQIGGRFLLRQDLHAKYFRSDDRIWIGSANVTGAALGWAQNPNLELLAGVDPEDRSVDAFEGVLFTGTTLVDRGLYLDIASAWQNLPVQLERETLPTVLDLARSNGSEVVELSRWLPTLRHPDAAYQLYCHPESDSLPRITRDTGMSDLRALSLPLGLDESLFQRVVGASLLTMPMVCQIDEFVAETKRFGAVRDFLQERLACSREEADRSWQTLIRWFRVFLADRYEYLRPRHSELITRRAIGDMKRDQPDP